jgi:hypothetical protein
MANCVRCASALLFVGLHGGIGNAVADTRSEILHYRFNGTGLTTPNSASNPPPFTGTAFLGGGFVQTGADLNLRSDGHSLVSPGALISAVDFLNTQWLPDLVSSSWTNSFVTQGIPDIHAAIRSECAGAARCDSAVRDRRSGCRFVRLCSARQ